jgi:hypothetical protein
MKECYLLFSPILISILQETVRRKTTLPLNVSLPNQKRLTFIWGMNSGRELSCKSHQIERDGVFKV